MKAETLQDDNLGLKAWNEEWLTFDCKISSSSYILKKRSCFALLFLY